jgi:hypothetical protein
MYDTMGQAGILSAGATANRNWNIDNTGDIPTSFDSPWLISVTNTTRNDLRNTGAAFGLRSIDLGAPGTDILSTVDASGYRNSTGTSMATPHVAGVIGLMYRAASEQLLAEWDANPGEFALMIRQFIMDGVDPIPALAGITVTGGRLNALNAVLSVIELNGAATGSVVVEGQVGTLHEGVAGTATFPVITEDIANGATGSVTWYTTIEGTTTTTAPTGITASVSAVSNDSATVTINTTAATLDGVRYFKVTISGVRSDVATLTIAPITPAIIPYTHDFVDTEENERWVLLNGTQANQWHIGTASYQTGARSLYISNDNGVSNNYNLTSISFVIAQRKFDFETTDAHTISFDWKCMGEGNWDNFRAFLVPTRIILVAGNAYGNTWQNNIVPTSWIAVSGVLSNRGNWQTFINEDVRVPSAGLYNLVFFWKNDNSGGTQPPAAIDSITVKKTVLQPVFSIYPTSLDFGDIAIGVSSLQKTFTIKNTGKADLIISEINLEGGDYDQFNIFKNENELPWTIAEDETHIFTAKFSPTSAGTKTTEISIVHNSTDSPSTVPIIGEGVLVEYTIDPVEYDFEKIIIGQTSPIETFTITNIGEVDFIVESIELAESGYYYYFDIDFVSELPWVIPTDGYQTFTVSFSPMSIGDKYAEIVITHNSKCSPLIIDVYGVGIVDVPGQVTLTSPKDGDTNQSIRPTLSWLQPTGAVVGYDIYISTEPSPYDESDPDSRKRATVMGDGNTTYTPDDDLMLDTTYFWQIVAFNDTGYSIASASWSFTVQTVSENEHIISIMKTELFGNHPNPFNPETTIRFSVENVGNVNIDIYNVRGQLVRTLVNGIYGSGSHSVVWNGYDDNGRPVSSGIYFYRMTTNEFNAVKRMILLK